MKTIRQFLFIGIIASIAITSCKKFLDEKPNQRLDVPITLTDFQALLDNVSVITQQDPSSSEISADNYYLLDADYLTLTGNFSNMYTWQKTGVFIPASNEWFTTYRPVFTSNTILKSIGNITVNPGNQADFNNVKGEALYVRAKAFLKVAEQWTSQYNPSTAGAQLGIPIRLGDNFEEPSTRSSLQQTYSQIVNDLTSAAALLPVTPLQVIRPSKPAAFALLARTYLFMGVYDKAGLYADSSLQLYNTLLDYNKLSATATYPFARFNAEVVHESSMITSVPISVTKARIDSNLYNSYVANDLRKTLFFKASTNNSHLFKGSYEGGVQLFSGVATDEVYLMRAECYARAGLTNLALADLNKLMITRFKTGTFVPFTATTSTAALSLVLTERRKELLMRGLRWGDLKRLNYEGANIILSRIIQGQTFSLAPNDLRYALPIPDDIIQMTGIPQNPR